MADDAAIQDLHRKIRREREIINAANNMRQASSNAAVASSIDSQVRESRRNIQYFEQTLQELQQRRMNDGMRNMNLGPGSNGPLPPTPHNGPRTTSSPLPPTPVDPYRDPGSYGPGGYSNGPNQGMMPNRGPYPPPAPGSPTRGQAPGQNHGQGQGQRVRPNYSRLGMLPSESQAHLS